MSASELSNRRRWLAQMADPWLGRDVLGLGSGLGDYAAEWMRPDRTVTLAEQEGGVAGRHSSVVALNVLERAEDDIAVLRSMADLLAPAGNLVVVVPAFPIAFSRFDREAGNHRRYTRHSLRAALASAGLQVLMLRYVSPLGLIGWLVVVRGLNGRPREGLLLKAYDRLVPLLRRAEERVEPPFGHALFAVATRPA